MLSILAPVMAGGLLKLSGTPLLVSWIAEVSVLAAVIVWRGRENAGGRRAAEESARVLDDIATKLAAQDAVQTVTDLLAELGNPKEPVQAVKTMAAERAALDTFLTATTLDADLVKAAADLAAERAQRAEADRKLATFLTTAGLDADLAKAAADLAAERARRTEADQKLETFLANAGLDADPVKAAAAVAAERARRIEADQKLETFLATAGLDVDPVKAAAEVVAERVRRVEADQKLATYVTNAADLVKAAADVAAERARYTEADQKLTTFLATTGLDADLVKAAAAVAAERAQRAEADQELATFLMATGLGADLVKAAANLAAERSQRAEADWKLTTFLTATGLDADLTEAAADLAAERAQRAGEDQKLEAFLVATGFDADLVKAAAAVSAERARRVEAGERAAADLASSRHALKELIDKANLEKRNLDAALDTANNRIEILEAESREAAIDKQVVVEDAKRFWTAEKSIRVLMSPIVPGGGNHSCIVPRKDGTAKMRLRFFVINVSPYDVKVTNIKFSFSATMDSFELSGEYDGPPGEQPDSVVKLAPWREYHFFVRVKGLLANVARIAKERTRIACLYLHGNCYATVRGHWDAPGRAPLTGNTDYILVSWEEFR